MDKTGAGPTKQKSRLKITHAQNDARYVEMGKLPHLTKDPSSVIPDVPDLAPVRV